MSRADVQGACPGGPTPGPAARFERSIAVVLGVDAYEPPMPPLRSAVADARAVAAALADDHGFEVRALFDRDVVVGAVRDLLERELPARLGTADRLLFYFAGHGIALDGDDGPAGCLLLHDARRDDPATFLPMPLLHDRLTALACRHALIVLDCCFAGSFRWSSLREAVTGPVGRIYRERYDRFVDSPAWQVLTSAASDQQAMDRLTSDRGEGSGAHSPFAAALLHGLRGGADYTDDGLVTAGELGLYLREQVERLVEGAGRRQTPQLFCLDRHERGEFVFQVPGRVLDLPAAPTLTQEQNPYRGLQAYEEADARLFFGRERAIERLVAAVEERPLTVVVGPSGSGKSSLVKAGLVRALRARGEWRIARPHRPGRSPLVGLRDAAADLAGRAPLDPDPVRAWLEAVGRLEQGAERTLVIVDQAEELQTHQRRPADRASYLEALAESLRRAPGLRLVVTVRSDAEPLFQEGPLGPWWRAGRTPIPPLTRAELREVIERPASENVLYFEPASLIDRLIDDVALLTAPLPLLSFALSELYRCYRERGADDRSLREEDYERLGGVARALTRRATELHDQLVDANPAFATTVQNLMLRMTTIVAGELTRRRVSRRELVYQAKAENHRVGRVLECFQAARLIVRGRERDAEEGPLAFVEPAHDELVRGWDKVAGWHQESAAARSLLLSLAASARDWRRNGHRGDDLWAGARVGQARALARQSAHLLNRREAAFLHASARRHRWRLGALVAAILVVIGGLTIAWQVGISKREAAEAATAATRRQLALTYQEQGRALLVAGDAARSLPYLVAARELGVDTPGLRMLFARARRSLWVVSFRHDGDGDERTVNAVAFSPNGRVVATASDDSTARLWDAATGAPRATLRHGGPVRAVAFSPDGTRVVTASDDWTARVWDAASGALLTAPLRHKGKVTMAAFSPGGQHILTATDHTDSVWDARSGEVVIADLTGKASPGAFSPDGTRIVTVFGPSAYVTDAATGEPLRPALTGTMPLASAVFSPDGSRIATVDSGGTVRLRGSATGRTLRLPASPAGMTLSAPVFSPDGAALVGTGGDHAGQLWRPPAPNLVPLPHGARIASAVFSPDGARVLTASEDNTARVWSAATGEPMTPPLRHDADVIAAIYSPDGSRILTASGDRALLWDASIDDPVSAPLRPDEQGAQVLFSPDGTRAVIVLEDRSAQIWESATGQRKPIALDESISLLWRFSDDRHLVLTHGDVRIRDLGTDRPPLVLRSVGGNRPYAKFSGDGRRVLISSEHHVVQVWDVASAQALSPPLAHIDADLGIELNTDGSQILSVATDHSVRIWDAVSGQAISRPFPHREQVRHAVFSADGALVLTASGAVVRVWDAATGRLRPPVLRHPCPVRGASVSPDGTRAVTMCEDGAVRVWDLATGQAVRVIHESRALDAVFSPDGGRVLAVGHDAAEVYDAGTGMLLEAFSQPFLGSGSFSPDGSHVVVRSWSNHSRVWNTSLDGAPLADWQAIRDRCASYELQDGTLVPRTAPSGVCRGPAPCGRPGLAGYTACSSGISGPLRRRRARRSLASARASIWRIRSRERRY